MEKLVEMGLVKSIGISNFTTKKVGELLEFAKVKPVCNQGRIRHIYDKVVPSLRQQVFVGCCNQIAKYISLQILSSLEHQWFFELGLKSNFLK